MSQYARAHRSFVGAKIVQFPLALALCMVSTLSYFLSFSAWIDTSWHDDQRILQLAFMLLAGVAGLLGIMRGRRLRVNCGFALKLSFAMFFLLGAYSGMRAFSPRHAFYEIAAFLMMLLLSMFIADEVSEERERSLDLVLKLCAAGCALYSFKFFIIYVLSVALMVPPDLTTLITGFANYRFFNHTQTVTLPLLVLLYAVDRDKTANRWGWLLLTAFWWALLLMTGGRGTMVGMAAGLAAAGLAQGRNARHFCKPALISAVAGFGLYVILFVLIPLAREAGPYGSFLELGHRSISNPGSSRSVLWQRAFELIYAHPWLGAGPMHFAHYSMDLNAGAHPHNLVLQIAAEWGLPALACLSAAIAFLMRGLLRTITLVPEKDARNQAFLSAWIVAGVAILVDSQFSGLIVMPLSALLTVLLLGCATGWAQSYPKYDVVGGRPPSPSRLRSAVVALLLVASMAGIVNGIWPGIGALLGFSPPAPAVAEQGASPRRPRLWTDGFF